MSQFQFGPPIKLQSGLHMQGKSINNNTVAIIYEGHIYVFIMRIQWDYDTQVPRFNRGVASFQGLHSNIVYFGVTG